MSISALPANSVQLSDRTGKDTARTQPSLPRVTSPTVVVLSGLLGSGKSSVLRALLARVPNPPSEKAAIFNEKDINMARSDAALLKDIDSTTLGGCACCLSSAELKSQVATFLGQGRKLLVIEQSGVTDGAALKASLQKELAGRAEVRMITVVDAEKVKASAAILHPSIVAADAVLLSHTHGDPGRITAGNTLVKAVRDSDPDCVQSFPGELPVVVWTSLFTSAASDRAEKKGSWIQRVLGSSKPQPSPVVRTDPVERRRVRDSLQSSSLILNTSVDRNSLKVALATSPIVIDRAKGWLNEAGRWVYVAYELKDDSNAVISFDPPVIQPPGLFGDRPHLLLMSCHGVPPAEHFASIGIPDFSAAQVRYFCSLYPGEAALDRALTSGSGVPVTADGDPLAIQAFRLTDVAHTFPASLKQEFDAAFLQLLPQYLTWRVAVAARLAQEPRAGMGAEYPERCATLGYATTWAYLRFGGILEDFAPELARSVIATSPVTLLLQGMATSKRLGIGQLSVPTPEATQDLVTMIIFGSQREPTTVTQPLAASALRNLESLARSMGGESWLQAIAEIRTELRGELGWTI